MPIRSVAVNPAAVEELRERFRSEAGCQIVRDSMIPRGLAAPYLLKDGQETVGYFGVWTEHFPGRLMEFFVLPSHRGRSAELFKAAVRGAEVREAEAQSNIASQHELVLEHTSSRTVENILFGDGPTLDAPSASLVFRRRRPGDDGPDGDWVVEREGELAGAGGVLTHYNAPYGDLYMEVAPDHRLKGVGRCLVVELRRVCREAGLIPAARCDPENEASRRTLLAGGLVEVGHIVAGPVVRP